MVNGVPKKIILCFDNSDRSVQAAEATILIAKAFGSEVVGVHGYNAGMHGASFRIMEPGLPEAYRREEVLHRQRELHQDLIRRGMESISLSYLRPLEGRFLMPGVPFQARVGEGKNFLVLGDLITQEDGDLVTMGLSGFSPDDEGFVGSVCLRLLRKLDRNFLLVRKPLDLRSSRFVVGLDGSASSVEALRVAHLYARTFGSEMHLLYVFDGILHRQIFGRLKESLIRDEGFSFNSKEQERLHDEFIDKGLEKVGWEVLDRAERDIDGTGSSRPPVKVKKVLQGPVYRRLCDYAAEVEASLIFLGRTGRHFAQGVDLGSVSENVVRFAESSVFVAKRQEEGGGWQV